MVQEIWSFSVPLSVSLSLSSLSQRTKDIIHTYLFTAPAVWGFLRRFYLLARASLAPASASSRARWTAHHRATVMHHTTAPFSPRVTDMRSLQRGTSSSSSKIFFQTSANNPHTQPTRRDLFDLVRQIVPRYVPLVVRRFTRLLCRLRLSPTGLAAPPCAEKRLASNGTHQVRIRAIERPGEIRAVVVEAGPKSREHLRGGAQ